LDNKKVSPGCSWKWEFLLFNAKSGYTAMCCDHDGERANVNEIINDPNKLINSPSMLVDRQLMLEGKSLPHCQGCYRHITEDTKLGGTFYDNHNTQPISHSIKSIGIMLNTTCLYTCVYCTSHFSSSWYSDIEKNGSYELHNQTVHKLSMLDKVTQKISLVDVKQSRYFDALNLFLKSSASSELSTLRIGGGEPLLHDNLIEFINDIQEFKPNLTVEIYTGLGISKSVLDNFIEQTKNKKDKIKIVLSQESAGKHAELMRYGTVWNKWKSMASQLITLGYQIEFNSVLNILSLFTLPDFLTWKNNSIFKDCILRIQPLVSPDYLSLNTLDKTLHEELLYKLIAISKHEEDVSSLTPKKYIPEYKNFERENLLAYLTEFIRRRNLDISVLPVDFLDFVNKK
jgi:molybdenum cofactor biosynthesis enzyme MoaA